MPDVFLAEVLPEGCLAGDFGFEDVAGASGAVTGGTGWVAVFHKKGWDEGEYAGAFSFCSKMLL